MILLDRCWLLDLVVVSVVLGSGVFVCADAFASLVRLPRAPGRRVLPQGRMGQSRVSLSRSSGFYTGAPPARDALGGAVSPLSLPEWKARFPRAHLCRGPPGLSAGGKSGR